MRWISSATFLVLATIPGLGLAEARFELMVLGVAQDGGVPHLGCFEACCADARKAGITEGAACLGIRDTQTGSLVLIEATPAIEQQLGYWCSSLGITRSKAAPVDAILLTHAHMGHYVGLAHFGREVAGSREVPVFVTPSFGTYLKTNGPWSQLVDLKQIAISTVTPGEAFQPIEGLRVVPIKVPHRDEFSDTMAYKISGPARTVLFVPDVDSWDKHPGLLDQLMEGVDVAYVDGTFWDGSELPHRDNFEIPHPLMTRSMEVLGAIAQAHPGKVRFIHLNHSNPAWRDEGIMQMIESRGFRLAAVGEILGL